MKTIRELQTTLPWTIRYSRDFRANPQSHKDFAHAMVHAAKAVGKLMALVDDMDHDRDVADAPALREQHAKYLADLVVCALRAANTFPGGVVDLQTATENRIATKNAPAPKEEASDVEAAERSVESAGQADEPDFNVGAFTGILVRAPDGECFLMPDGKSLIRSSSYPAQWFKWLEVGSDVELTIYSGSHGAPITWKGQLRRTTRSNNIAGVAIGKDGMQWTSADWFNGIKEGETVKVIARPAR